MHTLPEKMRGIQLTGHGGTEKLVLRNDIPVPQPASTDVVVKVSAAGVNNTDINTRVGWYSKSDGDPNDAGWAGNSLQFPRIQGADVCGHVVGFGDQVNESLMGKRVLIEPCLREAGGIELDQPWYLGSECDGGFAEYVVVAANHVYPVETTMSDVELASFPCSYSTAENLLTRSGVVKDDLVFVTGASGGVGSAAIQLARARGARVVAQSSPAKFDMIRQLGAEQVLSRDAELEDELGKNSIDVVIDLVAGPVWPSLLEILRPMGRYATAGAIAGPLVELDVRTLYLKDLTFYGCTVLGDGVFKNLVDRIETKAISPLVHKTYSLDQLADAQEDFQTKQHVGKLVIDFSLSS